MAEIVNTDQAAAWDAGEGDEWTKTEAWRDAAVRALSEHLFAAAAVASGDHVLDVGCGTGQATREAARLASSGDALGVDLSTQMLERARLRSADEGLGNVRFDHADAQVHPFEPDSIDLVISRNGVMFFSDPVAAFTNIAVSTKPGARLALAAWQELDRNEWVVALRAALAVGRTLPIPPPHAPGPFGLADADFVRATLGAAGFADVELADVATPFWFGADVDEAFANAQSSGVVKGLLDDLGPNDRAQALVNLRATIVAHDGADGVAFDSRSWIITARKS